MKKTVLLLAVVVAVLLAGSAFSKIDLVTLPERGGVQITIYNSEDITLVKEMRAMSFKKGMNEIQFSWVGTLIDPTSLELIFKTDPDKFEILDITFPPNVQNTLIWHIDSEISGESEIEIFYFTSGLTWKADYVVVADVGEKNMSLTAYVTVTNNSGEDYENTETRLIVGEIHLTEKIAELARRGIIFKDERKAKRRAVKAYAMMAEAEVMERMGGVSAPKAIIKEGISEYFLYSIEGKETIKNSWSKKLLSFSKDDVPFTLTYIYDDEKYGSNIIKRYKLKNDKEAKLGDEPLPNGSFNVFRETADGGLSFVNRTSHKYIPVGEDIELNLGTDGLITFEPKKMNFVRDNIEYDNSGYVSGWDITEEWILEIRNSKNEAVPLEVTKHFSGDWEIKTDDSFKQKDNRTVEFKLTVPELGKREIKYTLKTHHGTRAN